MPGRIQLETTPDGSTSPLPRITIKNTGMVLIASGTAAAGTQAPGSAVDESSYTDTIFFVSGTVGSRGSSSVRGVSTFGGDLVVSGGLTILSASTVSITSSMLDIGWNPNDLPHSTGPTIRLTSYDNTVNTSTTLGSIEFWS